MMPYLVFDRTLTAKFNKFYQPQTDHIEAFMTLQVRKQRKIFSK